MRPFLNQSFLCCMIDSLSPSSVATLRRRSPESPTLWLLLLAGSILLHVALFLLLRPLWLEQVGGQGGDGSVEIELADAASETGQTSLSAASPKSGSIALAPIAAAPPTLGPETEADIQAPPRSSENPVARSPEKPAPPPTSIPSTPPPPNAAPRRGQPEPKTNEIAAAPSPLTQPSPKTQPPQPPQPPQPLQTPKPQNTLATSDQALPGVPPISGDLNQGNSPPSGTGAPISITVTPAPVVSQEVRLTIVRLRSLQTHDPLTPGSDYPDRPAQPVTNTTSSPYTSIPPCIRGSIGNEKFLKLGLTLDNKGVPKVDPDISSSSTCDITKFAEGLVRREIRFRPAQEAGSPVESNIEIEVKLSLV